MACDVLLLLKISGFDFLIFIHSAQGEMQSYLDGSIGWYTSPHKKSLGSFPLSGHQSEAFLNVYGEAAQELPRRNR